ncbi:MAG: hypothetical protein AAB534_00380 [Patescibacteria group bacterium]|mgnify:CR=1 FL=1
MQTQQGKVSSHPQAHLDELVAEWLLRTFAADQIPEGTRLGEGGGEFDEHMKGGGRIKGECSATRVARHLNLDTDHQLAALLGFTLRTDEGPPEYIFDLAAVVMKFRRVHPDQTNKEKYEWVKVALDAYMAVVRNCQSEADVKMVLAEARHYPGLNFHSILHSKGVHRRSGGFMAGKLYDMADKASPSSWIHPWDITAVARMIASVYGDKVAVDWFDLPVATARIEDEEYRLAGIIFGRDFYQVEVGGGIIAWGKTNNPQVGKAGRSRGARIVIQQTETDNIMIFTNDQAVSEELMDAIVVAVKANETDNSEEVWYYLKGKQRMLLNGSDSRPDVPPTKQSLRDVADTVIATVREWCKRR